jgi:deoxyribodipyrimidine photolyase-related protein
MGMNFPNPVRHLNIILGDQLDANSALFDDFDPAEDLIWMAETLEEASHVWNHKIRLSFFFSAMRHFRDQQLTLGHKALYHALSIDPSADRGKNFAEILEKDLETLQVEKIRMVMPGDFRVKQMLQALADDKNLDLQILPDRHFYVSPEIFSAHSKGRQNLVMEFFYREQRKRFDVLIDPEGRPEGGSWNYDDQNRESFGKKGPQDLPSTPTFLPDVVTREVMDMVEQRFTHHPGELESFDWPVTAESAQQALDDFIQHRLPNFGRYEDAMWQEEALLFHSRLSALLNVKLLDPRSCVDAAVAAYHSGKAPLHSVEGFVRQILGWREFIRGIYLQEMPGYADGNALQCTDRNVPTFFWDGETDMACVADCMQSVLKLAWSHHIPRLMVLGQFSLLLGVHPYKFHQWHMAMYADAIDWVSLPNTLGMSQFGDGGIVGTKPYCASGNYINKMSNYCRGCKYDYKKSHGENACPFTTLYWDFLDRHHDRFAKNPRMKFQMNHLKKKSAVDMSAIRNQAETLRRNIDNGVRF